MSKSGALLMTVPVGRAEAEKRIGDWMITFTGRRFWPLDPRVDEVSFLDIAHGLSLICRYGGHTRCFYSVAEHCVHLAQWFVGLGDRARARHALLHDGSEAYIGDIIRPLKPQLPQFKAIEDPLQRLIQRAAGLGAIPKAVHAADSAIIANEAQALFYPEVIERAGWVLPASSLRGVEIAGWMPADAEREWLGAFRLLFPELVAS